jgi:DNA-binding phage protein
LEQSWHTISNNGFCFPSTHFRTAKRAVWFLNIRMRKPSFTRAQFMEVRHRLGQSAMLTQIAKDAGLSRQTVYRIKNDPAACEAALEAWGI